MFRLERFARSLHRYRLHCAGAAVAGLAFVGAGQYLPSTLSLLFGLFLFGWGWGLFLITDWFSKQPGSGSWRPQKVRPVHAVAGACILVVWFTTPVVTLAVVLPSLLQA